MIPINFREESCIVTICRTELHVLLEVSKGCEASCRNDAGTYSQFRGIGLHLKLICGTRSSFALTW